MRREILATAGRWHKCEAEQQTTSRDFQLFSYDNTTKAFGGKVEEQIFLSNMADVKEANEESKKLEGMALPWDSESATLTRL